jgi:urease accessory protein
LTLVFHHEKSKTLLSHKEHFGPLMVQKVLYPEEDPICHAVILHPPAGIAGGDHLSISLSMHRIIKGCCHYAWCH